MIFIQTTDWFFNSDYVVCRG